MKDITPHSRTALAVITTIIGWVMVQALFIVAFLLLFIGLQRLGLSLWGIPASLLGIAIPPAAMYVLLDTTHPWFPQANYQTVFRAVLVATFTIAAIELFTCLAGAGHWRNLVMFTISSVISLAILHIGPGRSSL